MVSASSRSNLVLGPLGLVNFRFRLDILINSILVYGENVRVEMSYIHRINSVTCRVLCILWGAVV